MEANRVGEKARHHAELTAVRAATAGLNRNQMKALPGHAKIGKNAPREPGKMSDQVELVKGYAVPRDTVVDAPSWKEPIYGFSHRL